MEAIIQIKYENPQELAKLLHNIRMNIELGSVEFDNRKDTKFRVLSESEPPIFEDEKNGKLHKD